MTTLLHTPPPEAPAGERFVLHGVSWEAYEVLVREVNDRRVRMTYDRGALELMSPSFDHERVAEVIGQLIKAYCDELRIDYRSAGSTTLRRRDALRGLEPDRCYYVASEALIRGRDDLDLTRDPPPDLAIEVDMTRRSIDREPIYAALGVPEVWRWQAGRIVVLRLRPDGTYAAAESSAQFPKLRVADLARFVERRHDDNDRVLRESFLHSVRD